MEDIQSERFSMKFAKFWCRQYIHISKRLLKAKLDYKQRQNKAKSAPAKTYLVVLFVAFRRGGGGLGKETEKPSFSFCPSPLPLGRPDTYVPSHFLEMDSASCPKFLSLFSVLLDSTKCTSRSLVRATSAFQYGGLLPLSDNSILLKIRIKTNSKWLQIFTILADTESWIIFLSGVNCFEHVARTG